MRALVRERQRAVELRKKGLSYSEILRHVEVAKSTLSEWLRGLPLTARERRTMRTRMDANISHGRIKAAAALRDRRLERERAVFLQARESFRKNVCDASFLVGVSLYWAEGSKRSSGFGFINSDPDMIVFMVGWIRRFLSIPPTSLKARLYIHKPYAHERLEDFWSERTGIPMRSFQKTILKTTASLVKKRPAYKGCLRLEIGSRAMLLTMLYWQQMLVERFRLR